MLGHLDTDCPMRVHLSKAILITSDRGGSDAAVGRSSIAVWWGVSPLHFPSLSARCVRHPSEVLGSTAVGSSRNSGSRRDTQRSVSAPGSLPCATSVGSELGRTDNVRVRMHSPASLRGAAAAAAAVVEGGWPHTAQ